MAKKPTKKELREIREKEFERLQNALDDTILKSEELEKTYRQYGKILGILNKKKREYLNDENLKTMIHEYEEASENEKDAQEKIKQTQKELFKKINDYNKTKEKLTKDEQKAKEDEIEGLRSQMDDLNDAVKGHKSIREYYQKSYDNHLNKLKILENNIKRGKKNLYDAKDKRDIYNNILQGQEQEKIKEEAESKNMTLVDEKTAEDIRKQRAQAQMEGKKVTDVQEGGSSGNSESRMSKFVNAIEDNIQDISKIINAGIDFVRTAVISSMKISLNTWMMNQEIYLKTIETNSKIFQRNITAFGKRMNGALDSAFSSITQGVQEGSFNAAQNAIASSGEYMKNEYDTSLNKLELENFKYLQQRETEAKNIAEANKVINGGMSLLSSVASAISPVAGTIASVVTNLVSTATQIQEAHNEIMITKLKEIQKRTEEELKIFNEAKKSAIDIATESVNKILNQTKEIEKFTLEMDKNIRQMALIVGISGRAVGDYERNMMKSLSNLTFQGRDGKMHYMDKSHEDAYKMQSAYNDSTERNTEISHKGRVKSFLLGQVFGDDTLAGSVLGGLDYFNQSIESSTDMIFKIYQQANKAGVSNRKFSKDLLENLKLAQKYTFKGGVEAMMKMSVWAQKTRFNIKSLDGILDNLQTGGLENIITKGAKLQVLGGRFAMGADPLAMMYESLSDPEALAKRFQGMIKGMGHFNKKTGNVDIAGNEALMLRAYAEASGVDYKDARAMVTQNIKNGEIDKQLRRNYTDAQKQLIYNKAQLNKKGQWVVTVGNEEKDINSLSGTDWNSLMPVEESIEHYVSDIYSILQDTLGQKTSNTTKIASETFDNTANEAQKRIDQETAWLNENMETITSLVKKTSQFTTKMQKEQNEQITASKNILDTEFSVINKLVVKMRKEMSESTSQFVQSLELVNAELNEKILNIDLGNEKDEGRKKELQKKLEEARSERITKENRVAKTLNIDPEETKQEVEKLKKKGFWGEIGDGLGKLMGKLGNFLIDTGPQAFINDGVVSGNNTSMLTMGSKVIPIQDGSVQFAKSDPKDSALFAKVGGPFDKLVNNVFGEVLSTSNFIKTFVQPLAINNRNTVLSEKRTPKQERSTNENIKFDDIILKLGGKVDLSVDGKNTNITKTLIENPLFVRAISQLINESLEQKINGGRNR